MQKSTKRRNIQRGEEDEQNRDELEKEEDEREEEIAKKTRKRWRRKMGRLNIFDELFHEYAMHEQQVAYETPRGSETGRKTRKHS